GVTVAPWVPQGVARNQTATVCTMPAAVGADVIVRDGGDDVPDHERPVHTGSGPLSPSVTVGALSPSNAASWSRIAASRRWSLAARSADRAGSWTETYVCDLAPTMSWNRAWRMPSSRGSLHRWKPNLFIT